MDAGEGEVLGTNSAASMDANSMDMNREEGETQQGHTVPANLSFRDMLVGRVSSSQPLPTIPELDVDVHEEDVQLSSIDGTHAIRFSDRIHDLVDAKLEHSVIAVSKGDENRVLGVNLAENEHRLMLKGSGSDPLCKVSHTSEKGGSVTVASKDVVVCEPVTLKIGNHVAVRVAERGADLGPKKGGGRCVMAGLKDGITKDKLRIGSAKGGVRPGNPVRKPQSSRAVSKVGLTEWAGSLDRKLESSLLGGGSSPHGGGEHNTAANIDVQ
ncbi:hypothetical protein V6N12_045810 [Hibiscus sabdariffa]|uniref:Uncharacterized protein n=1 Tax=Hibiscus sabdariffa TaxID=183260 RepID=A0ABR2G3V8_9ROSI